MLLKEPFPDTQDAAEKLISFVPLQAGELSIVTVDSFEYCLEKTLINEEICLGEWRFKANGRGVFPYYVKGASISGWSPTDTVKHVQEFLLATSDPRKVPEVLVIASEDTNDVVFWFDEAIQPRRSHHIYCPMAHAREVAAAVRTLGYSICKWSADSAFNP